MTAADGTRLDPRLTAVFDAGAHWATEPTDRRGYGDALRDAVERATTPGDDRGRELADDPRVRSLIAGSLDQAWRAGATGETGGTAERTDAVMRGLRALAEGVAA